MTNNRLGFLADKDPGGFSLLADASHSPANALAKKVAPISTIHSFLMYFTQNVFGC